MRQLDIRPTLARSEVARLLGGRRVSSLSHAVVLRIEKLEVALKELLKPKLYYRKLEIASVDPGVIRLQEGVQFRAPKLAKAVKGSNELVCFIATVGKPIEQKTNQLIQENHLATAYILDSMGSVAVESVVEKFHNHMAKKLEAVGNAVTLRFSPGYCDWPITEQKKLFGLFDTFQLDVKLSDSCLMQPRKSISGVFGVLPSHLKPPGLPYNPCSDCKKHDCIARRG